MRTHDARRHGGDPVGIVRPPGASRTPPGKLFRLQRSAGNRAVAGLMAQRTGVVRREAASFEGVTNYRATPKATLIAAGYKFMRTERYFDYWRSPKGGILWAQVPKVNAATSEGAIKELSGVVALRKRELDNIQALARTAKSPDPDVAQEAQELLDEALADFPGFDDDYSSVASLRDKVDAEHKAAFEAQARALAEQRDRYDPQSALP